MNVIFFLCSHTRSHCNCNVQGMEKFLAAAGLPRCVEKLLGEDFASGEGVS